MNNRLKIPFKIFASSPVMILTAVCIVQFMAPFMLTSIGIALPSIGKSFGASAMQLGLVEQLYLLSLAMTMLTFGRLGDIAGQSRVFISGLFVFTLFTLSLGFAGNIHIMMFLRFFQGSGASMMLSGSMAIVAAAYPPELRTRKIGIVSACTYTGLSMGPVIGGYVTVHLGWKSIFFMAAPIGIIAIITSFMGMKKMDKNAEGEAMDWKGSICYALSVGLIMSGAVHARTPMLGLPIIGAGIIGIFIFIHIERNSSSPLLDISLLARNRFFTLSSLAALGNYAATFGITFMMSLFLQYGKHFSPKQAGFVLVLQPFMQVVTSLLAGTLSRWFETTRIATAGMLISSAGLLLTAATLGAGMPIWLIAVELMMIGSGFGIFVTPNSSAIMGSVERRYFGVASGMIGAMRTLGMAVSMTSAALIFSIFMGNAAVTESNLPVFIISMRTGLVVFAIFSCMGIIISFGRLKNKEKSGYGW